MSQSAGVYLTTISPRARRVVGLLQPSLLSSRKSRLLKRESCYLSSPHISVVISLTHLHAMYGFVSCARVCFKIKTNTKMCILMYFKIQRDQPRITRNALKNQIFHLFTKS